MNKIIAMSIFSAILGFMSCNAQSDEFKSVEVEAFSTIIADTNHVVVLDVRTAEEYTEGHIDNALNIDVKRDDFESKALAALPKNKTIALYCRSGNRSKRAATILASQGFKVVELNSGYLGWIHFQHQEKPS
ncbi:MAG: rhodanese-like domain-containing protein [Bacteroidales bacterium]|nr:rhodanese-like domain-containing protein [Bacteroidales bacterium]